MYKLIFFRSRSVSGSAFLLVGWILIRVQEGKKTLHKIEKCYEISCLKWWMFSFEGVKASDVAWTSFKEAKIWVNCNFSYIKKYFSFSSKNFPVFGHQNPGCRAGSGIKPMRIRNTGLNNPWCGSRSGVQDLVNPVSIRDSGWEKNRIRDKDPGAKFYPF